MWALGGWTKEWPRLTLGGLFQLVCWKSGQPETGGTSSVNSALAEKGGLESEIRNGDGKSEGWSKPKKERGKHPGKKPGEGVKREGRPNVVRSPKGQRHVAARGRRR